MIGGEAMKLWKRLLSLCCATLLLLTSVDYVPVYAAMSLEDDSYYNQLLATQAAPYLMTCQPDDAIILTDTIEVTADDITDNYYGGVVNLPRLASDYYYTLGGNTNFYLGSTVYPILCFKSAAVGQSVTLSIKSYLEKKTLVSFTVQITDDTLQGIDYWYPNSDYKDIDGNVIIPARKFADCSYNLVQTLIDAGDAMRSYTTNPLVYDHALHKDSIVMDNYVYTPNVDYACLSDAEYDNTSVESLAYTFTRQSIGLNETVTSYNIKDYLGTLDAGQGIRTGLLFAGSKFDGCSFDCNTGESTTVTTVTDSEPLYYFIAISSKCYFGKISTNTIDTDAFTEAVDDSPTMLWESDTYYNLQSDTDSTEGGYTSELPENYLNYGPVSFDDFWKVGSTSTYNVSLRSGSYSFLHDNKNTVENFNVFANTLIYAGCIPHLANATLKERSKTITIRYYYVLPTDNEGTWRELICCVYPTKTFDESSLETLDSIDYYEPNIWYTDAKLTNKFDPNSIDVNQDTDIVLYGGYNYVGGTYTVTYINSGNGASTTEEYQLDKLPTLPANPEPVAGYSFKYWGIVESADAESGVSYNPATFKPVSGANYKFKTMWDISGIILKVLTTKTNYYVGDDVDRTLLQVWVQDSNDVNNTRVLEQDEYDISGLRVSKVGTNQFTITYKATGATAICEVNGMEVIPTSISATYKGGDIIVGTELDNGDFEVYVVYNNGKSNKITDFTLSPNKVKTLGANTITIKHMDYSTSVNITGIKDPASATVLKSISASYTGKQPYAGDKIKSSDLLVTAFYADGSYKTLPDTAFKFTPNKFATAGEQSITVTYSGLSVPVKVKVKEVVTDSKEDDNKDNDGKDDNSKDDKDKENTSNDDSNDNNSSDNNNNSNSNDNNSSDNDNSNNNTNNNSSDNNSNSNNNNSDNNSNNNSNTNNNSNNSNNSNNNSNSNSNNSNNSNSSNVNSSSNSNESAGDVTTKDGKGTSIGYLSGANILTNTMGLANATANAVINIKEIIDNAKSGDDVFITMTNGANGNDLTTDVLSSVKSKELNVHLNMISTTDNASVANWLIIGSELDATPTINPNITFNVTDKDSDRLVHFAPASIAYPNGCSLSVYPSVSCYGSGELVRMYSCDISKNNSKLLQTLTWQDSLNSFVIDLYDSNYSYCLSNSVNAYEDGASLLTESGLPSVDDSVEEVPIEDGSVAVEDTEEDFDWGDDTTSVEPKPKSNKGLLLLIVIITLIGLAAGGAIITLLLKSKKSKQLNNQYSDYEESYTNDDFEDDV